MTRLLLLTKRRAGLAASGLVLLTAALAECGFQLHFEEQAPSPEAYDALVAPMAAVHEEGDLVLVRPAWAEPHVRRALGDAYFPREGVGRAANGRFARAVEILLPGGDRDPPTGFRVARAVEAAPFTLRVLENVAYRPAVFDFVRKLGNRHATVRGTDPPFLCAFRENAKVSTGRLGGPPAFPRARFECEALETQVSRSFVTDERWEPRDCIYAQPPETGERVIQFTTVPLGQSVEGHTLIHWMTSRTRTGAPVSMTVRINGDVIGEITHADGDGWAPFRFDTGTHAGKPDATVEFVIASEGGERREFCFEALSL